MLFKFYRSLLLGLVLISFQSFAQENSTVFVPLRTQGEIPKAIFVPTQTKIQEAQKEANKIPYKSIDQKSNVSSFLYNSNYELDYLMRSGKIIFDNDITRYLSSVLDLVLSDEPELRNRIQIYLLKSTEVNAYATQQGYIFVTIGLLAQLENEAQLAFILGHEAQHISGNHSIKYVLANSKHANGEFNSNKGTSNTRVSRLAYSRIQETEADTAGFTRTTRAGYKASSAISSMDVLQLSFIPFTNAKFDFSEVETPDFKIPIWAIADSVQEIPFNTDEEEDSNSSHPNIVSRRKALLDINVDNEGGKNFIVSKENFEKTIRACRFEMVFLHLIDGDYASSLYLSNALLQKYPNNQFLEEAFAKSLYGVYAYRANNKKSQINFNDSKHYGEMQRMSMYFNNLETTELGLITFRELYEVEQKYHNPFITHVFDDFMGMFSTKSKKTLADLIKKKNYSVDLVQKGMNVKHEDLVERIKTTAKTSITVKTTKKETVSHDVVKTDDDSSSDSKYEKLRTSRGEKQVKKEEEYTEGDANEAPDWLEHYIYLTLHNINETAILARYDSVAKLYATGVEDQKNWEKEYASKQRKYERNGFDLGLDSLLIVDPFYVQLLVTSHKTQVQNVDNGQIQLANYFKSEVERKSFHGELLAWQTMNAADTSRFNSMAEMNDWFEEIKRHSSNDVEMIALTTDYFKPILDEYHCKYVVFPGAVKIHDKTITRPMQTASLILPSIFAPPIAIAAIGMTISAHYGTEYFYYVYNLEDGTMLWHHQNTIEGKLSMNSTEIYFQDLIRQTISK